MSEHTLHVLSHGQALPALQRLWQDGDCLLLSGDAVYLAITQHSLPDSCVALHDAVAGRGLSERWPANIPTISYEQWVVLSTDYARSVSWS